MLTVAGPQLPVHRLIFPPLVKVEVEEREAQAWVGVEEEGHHQVAVQLPQKVWVGMVVVGAPPQTLQTPTHKDYKNNGDAEMLTCCEES